MKSTAGARFLAHEKFQVEEQRVSDQDYSPVLHPPLRGPLVERLSLASLRAVADLFGWSLKDMTQRYKWVG